ncbi:MAG: HypC/HybG/HupF family hydrogenase formation chaperone [bacterium]
MCLTIPKKVVEVRGDLVVVEDFKGDRQEMKTIVELAIGDFVMSQQNVVLEKMDKRQAQEIFNIINERK